MRSKTRALVEGFDALGVVGQALAHNGWQLSKHSTPQWLQLFFYGDGFVSSADVELLNGVLYASGGVKREFTRDTRNGERSHDEESYLDEVSQLADETPLEFAQRVHELYSRPGEAQPTETFDDEVGPDHGYHKQHPMDRF